MNFLTSYDWRQGEGVSLVLQQARRKKGSLAILLAGVCGEDRFAEHLTDWFYEEGLPLCRKGSAEKVSERVWQSLDRQLKERSSREEMRDFAMLFCAGEECVYAWWGEAKLQALNRQFGRAQVTELTRWTEGYGLERAQLEANVGILLGMGGFFESLPTEVVRSCLKAVDLNGQQQADRHLAEVCGEAARRGAGSRAAILVLSKEDAG